MTKKQECGILQHNLLLIYNGYSTTRHGGIFGGDSSYISPIFKCKNCNKYFKMTKQDNFKEVEFIKYGD